MQPRFKRWTVYEEVTTWPFAFVAAPTVLLKALSGIVATLGTNKHSKVGSFRRASAV